MDRRPTLSTTERQRLFGLHDGICHICFQPIDGVRERWEIEHVISRGLIGKAADTDENMRPAHARVCHPAKTAKDAGDLARAKRREAKHHGAYRPRSTMPGSRNSAFKRLIGGGVVRRHQPVHEEA